MMPPTQEGVLRISSDGDDRMAKKEPKPKKNPCSKINCKTNPMPNFRALKMFKKH